MEPPKHVAHFLQDETITLSNIGFIRQNPYSNKYNTIFNDDDAFQAVLEDLRIYKQCGGSSIVDNTSHGIGRNFKALYELSTLSGVNVISGTGHYLQSAQKPDTIKLTVEQLAEIYTKDIVEGANIKLDNGETVNVKCGFIGEVASDYPISDFERRAIVASAEVQSSIKCGVGIHPGLPYADAPFEIVRIYLEAGGDASKCNMNHLDSLQITDDQLLEFSDLGTYIEFDAFYTEVSWCQYDPNNDGLSDADKVNKIKLLVDHGKVDRILMSHDVHAKTQLIKFGGQGFCHILNNVKPKMLIKGFTEEQIDTIMIKNPATWLQC